MVDEKLSDTEAIYYASKINMLIPKLGGLLKFYSDPTSVYCLTFKKPLSLARVSKIAEYPVRIYTRDYQGRLNITPYNIVKQLPRATFVDDDLDAIMVKVKVPSNQPAQDFYSGTAIAYKLKNKSQKLILQKPILDLRDKAQKALEENLNDKDF